MATIKQLLVISDSILSAHYCEQHADLAQNIRLNPYLRTDRLPSRR